MQRAFDLAQLGREQVSPNPMVGCVIVHQDIVIAEGYHQKYGTAHAEVNAFRAVKQPELLPESEIYVSLEPCSHYGKTPPCADLIIKHRPKKLWVANLDPNPLVAGKGISKIQEAGIEVVTGILASEGEQLNRRFFTYMTQKRPYIILKWAQTQDGFISRTNYSSKWISNAHARRWVHQWRSQEDAILVGTNTALYDNPLLTTRDWVGKNPIRLVLDAHLRLPQNLHIFDKKTPTLCFNFLKNDVNQALEYIKISPNAVLTDILNVLYERKIMSVIVEGGTQLLQTFINEKLWDETRILKSNQRFETGIAAPQFVGKLTDKIDIDDNTLLQYFPI
jgi:diaminohydroxyphosphoribosylaminopyrimidine deaminase/5-amino-6-(5-phosphoribosylamino)uracil reductase